MANEKDRVIGAIISILLKFLGILAMGGSLLFAVHLWQDEPGTLSGRILTTIFLVIFFILGALCFKVSCSKEKNTNDSN
jgi:hypothetical protein